MKKLGKQIPIQKIETICLPADPKLWNSSHRWWSFPSFWRFVFVKKNISFFLFLLNMYFHRDKTEFSGALKASYILKALIR